MQKLKNNEPRPKFTVSYKIKRVLIQVLRNIYVVNNFIHVKQH